jgi:hypothetical protein
MYKTPRTVFHIRLLGYYIEPFPILTESASMGDG